MPRSYWRFGRIEDDGTYIADPNYICAEGRFEKGRLYQIVYTTVGAPVMGLSFAGLRDCVSWFKYGSHDADSPIDISYAYAYGRSQTGRYLRTYIYNDFNRDETGTRGARRHNRQCCGRNEGRVQPAVRTELEGPATTC